MDFIHIYHWREVRGTLDWHVREDGRLVPAGSADIALSRRRRKALDCGSVIDENAPWKGSKAHTIAEHHRGRETVDCRRALHLIIEAKALASTRWRVVH